MVKTLWLGILLGLVCSGVSRAQGVTGQEKPAAIVNGEAIPMAEVKAILDVRPLPLVPNEAQKREMRQAALDMLIEDVLMRQFLRKNAPPPNPADIEKELN